MPDVWPLPGVQQALAERAYELVPPGMGIYYHYVGAAFPGVVFLSLQSALEADLGLTFDEGAGEPLGYDDTWDEVLPRLLAGLRFTPAPEESDRRRIRVTLNAGEPVPSARVDPLGGGRRHVPAASDVSVLVDLDCPRYHQISVLGSDGTNAEVFVRSFPDGAGTPRGEYLMAISRDGSGRPPVPMLDEEGKVRSCLRCGAQIESGPLGNPTVFPPWAE